MNLSKIEMQRKTEVITAKDSILRTDIMVTEFSITGMVNKALLLTSEEEACEYYDKLTERLKRNNLQHKMEHITDNDIEITVFE